MISRSKLAVVFVVVLVAACGSTTNDSGGDAGSAGVDGGGAAGTGANGGDGGVGTDGDAGAAGGTSGSGASGGVGGGSGGTSGTGASGGAGGVGGSAGAGPCSALCGAPGCPACRGPDMIAAPFSGAYAYRIDSTEVTNAHYAEFLAAGVSASAQPGACAKNTTFVPDMSKPIGCTAAKYDPVNRADFPVLCVDWCDARAYCEWAGKRLCMDMDGEETGGKGSDEWVNACTALETLSYPYGNDYDAAACNGADMALHDAVPVGSLATCEGGLPGLFDMSGNAWEWVGTCDDKPEPSCSALGGGFSIGNAPQLKCGTVAYTFAPWSTSGSDMGFRCCADGLP